jgi:hypothetical protein
MHTYTHGLFFNSECFTGPLRFSSVEGDGIADRMFLPSPSVSVVSLVCAFTGGFSDTGLRSLL